MSVSNKVKALLQLNGYNISKFAKATGQTQPNISNKIARNTWTVQEFLKLANFTNTKLAFLDENNEPLIIFNHDDIEEK